MPSSIGRYRVLRVIGEGGMGTVFEAQDEVLGRRVAIKRLKGVADASARRRFWREARAVARLSHPNVCPLYEVGEDASGPFLAMELLSGESVAARLRQGPMGAAEAVSLGTGVLAALQTIHAAGLVHRDLKPSNVYLTPHGPRLLDFGLVGSLKAADALPPASTIDTPSPLSQSPLTGTQVLIGTPGYMAPEQIYGNGVDGRADLFATGAMLYEALSGRRAFGGATPLEALAATLHETPPALGPPLERIDAVLQRALSKRRDDRYATAQEMAEALHAASAPVAARFQPTKPGPEPTRLFAGRHAELAWLEERLEGAVAGSGGLVLVTGERGAGKSALVGELLRRVRSRSAPMTIVAGRCVEHDGPGEAFQPFLDAIGRLFAGSAREQALELCKTWAPTVGVLLQRALVPDPDGSLHRQTAGATRERLIREGGDYLEAATRLYPMVLLLEDLHWADAASVDMLRHLARRAARMRILFLGTCRPSELEATNAALHRGLLDLRTAGQAHELPLGPIGSPDVEEWLDARFPCNDFARGLAPLLHARSEGLPLFVRSLIELLASRRDIEPSNGGFRLAKPLETLDLEPSKDVKDLVRTHLATLPLPDRELLAAASVLGKDFSSAIARGLATGDELELEDRLQRLCRTHRVLESRGEEELPDGALGTRDRFAPGLYQRVLYEDLVAPRRAELHRRAGELLLRHWGENAQSHPAEMAEHFARGRDTERAVRFRTLAGDNATRRFAGMEAVEHYNAALQLLHKQPSEPLKPLVAVLHGRRAAACLLLARFDEAARDYEAMLERAREAGNAAAACEALSGLCNAHFFEQRPREMAARAREALQAAERLGSRHHVAEARGRAALALVMEGQLAEACGVLDTVIAEARASGSQIALQLGLAYRGFVHYWHAEFQACEAKMTEALGICEERGDGFEAFVARMFQGLARVNQGRISEGLSDLVQAELLAARNGDRYWQPRFVSLQGYVHRELAAVGKARKLDERALALARENPSPWTPEIDALLNLCIDGVRAGDPEAAADALALLEDRSRSRDWFRWMNDLRLQSVAAEHYAARGAYDATALRVSRLDAAARRVSARNYVCAAARMRGELALACPDKDTKALPRLERALGALRGLAVPLEAWKAGRVVALLRRQRGDEKGAQAAFAAAASHIDTIVQYTDQPALRNSFLGSRAVREVLAEVGRI